MSKILYLTQTYYTATSVRLQFPRDILDAAPLVHMAGRRGDVIVVEPLRADATGMERRRFDELLEQARTKVRVWGTPLIIGEIVN